MFYSTILLFLLLPVGRHFELFLFGGRTDGVATYRDSSHWGSGTLTSTVFEFKVNGYSYFIEGPSNVDYKMGEKCKVIFKKKNPRRCIIPSFSYLYLSINAALSASLLITWIAFYTSFYGLKNQNKNCKSDKLENRNNVF